MQQPKIRKLAENAARYRHDLVAVEMPAPKILKSIECAGADGGDTATIEYKQSRHFQTVATQFEFRQRS